MLNNLNFSPLLSGKGLVCVQWVCKLILRLPKSTSFYGYNWFNVVVVYMDGYSATAHSLRFNDLNLASSYGPVTCNYAFLACGLASGGWLDDLGANGCIV